MRVKNLLSEYKKKKRKIKRRLREFRRLHKAEGKDIFQELSFCILTPQSKAVYCDKAVKGLKNSGALFKGCARAISKGLKGMVRFHNKKAAYIVAARNFFSARGRSAFGGKNSKNALDIKSRLESNDTFKTRDWLVKNIKGLGYKEASHFLRNIGLGEDMAILDTHILKNLKKYKVINNTPSSINRKKYLKFEEKMRQFAKRIKIPIEELDLLFWSEKTGYIFK